MNIYDLADALYPKIDAEFSQPTHLTLQDDVIAVDIPEALYAATVSNFNALVKGIYTDPHNNLFGYVEDDDPNFLIEVSLGMDVMTNRTLQLLHYTKSEYNIVTDVPWAVSYKE